MTVHIINTHLTYPNWTEGNLNAAMVGVAREFFESKGHSVTVTKVEDGYDAETEERCHLDAELVIVQTPINWFGAPWIYKKYVDEVFNMALANQTFLAGDGRSIDDPSRQYGTGGKMVGKKFFIATTWNAPKSTFDNVDSVLFEGKSADDLLLNITSNYLFTGFEVLPSFGIYNIFRDKDIEQRLLEYRSYLATIKLQ
jgi:modulator of drug activity B